MRNANEQSRVPESPDIAVDEACKSFGSRILSVMERIDKSIDRASEHVADSFVDGARAFIHSLFHPKKKEQNNSHPQHVWAH